MVWWADRTAVDRDVARTVKDNESNNDNDDGWDHGGKYIASAAKKTQPRRPQSQ